VLLGLLDVEGNELAIGVFIVHWWICRASADHKPAAVENLLQTALAGLLGQRRARGKPRRHNRRTGESRTPLQQIAPIRERPR
jgi:hypothetical protein